MFITLRTKLANSLVKELRDGGFISNSDIGHALCKVYGWAEEAEKILNEKKQ